MGREEIFGLMKSAAKKNPPAFATKSVSERPPGLDAVKLNGPGRGLLPPGPQPEHTMPKLNLPKTTDFYRGCRRYRPKV